MALPHPRATLLPVALLALAACADDVTGPTPAPGGALLVAGAMGVMRSVDAGQTWKTTLPSAMATDLLVDEASGVVYALRGGGAVDRSADDGATWQRIAAPVYASIDWTPDALARTADGHLVTGNWKGIWRSTATSK